MVNEALTTTDFSVIEARLDALIHYICARCDDPGRLSAIKLHKILWYSDVYAFSRHGTSVTGTTYVKRQFGPVPRNILAARARLRNAGLIVERQALFINPEQTQLIALQVPDISMFSASEISLVDLIMYSVFSSHTANSISVTSHDLVWEAAAIGEEIPMSAAAFAGNIGEIDEDDMAWARQEIAMAEDINASA